LWILTFLKGQRIPDHASDCQIVEKRPSETHRPLCGSSYMRQCLQQQHNTDTVEVAVILVVRFVGLSEGDLGGGQAHSTGV
jgi:hypothetical protein